MFTAAPLPSVGFVNAGAKTCHLGAALHVLFQVKPFVDALHALPLPASCACACCLLLETHKDVLRGEKAVSVQRWRQWFVANGLDFDTYQAVGDVVQKLLHSAQNCSHGVFASQSPLEMFAIQLREESQRICSESCVSVQPVHEQFDYPFLSLWLPCAATCSLQSSLESLFFSTVVPPDGKDAPLCVSCGQRMGCRKRTIVVASAAFLLLEVNRAEGSTCALHGYENIRFNNAWYSLKAVATYLSQHFAAHVRNTNYIRTFDDTHVVDRQSWPPTVARDCKLLLFALDPDAAALPKLEPPWLPAASLPPSLLDATATGNISADASTVLRLFCAGLHVPSFLVTLPFFLDSGLTHGSLPKILAAECDTLTREHINAAAALECRFGFADTMFYPLAVLLQATAMSVGMPAIFYVDVVLGLINSLFERHLAVDLRRFPSASRNRYWVAAVANVGEGKSPASAPIVALLQEVLAQYPHLAPGTATDRFHYQQNSTSACARDKLRACDGYLTVYSDEAGLCLSSKYAAGGDIDPYRHIDLGLFLNAAHGGEFDFATLRERMQLGARRKPRDPKGPIPEEEGLQLNPTNIHFLFLQQEYYFNHFWAQLASDKPVGLAHRFLFSFGAYENPPPASYSGFFQAVTAPILRRIFELVLVRFGPKVVAARDLTFQITEEQGGSVKEIHELVTAIKRREVTVAQALRLAMPKSMYWLATAMMTSHVLEQLWAWVFCPFFPHEYYIEITDPCFFSAVRFVHRRFLRGHAILAVNAAERAWLVQRPCKLSEEESFFLRVLRGCPQQVLSVDECCACDLDFKRAWLDKSASVDVRLFRLWQLCTDIGLGRLSCGALAANTDPKQVSFVKFPLSTLHEQAKEWLLRYRVPLENWTFPMLALETCPRVEPVLRPTAPTPPATVPTADAKGSPAAKASSPVLSSVHNSVSHGHGASCCSSAAMCRPQVSASGAPFAAPCPPEVPASPAGSAASRDNPAFLAACTFGLPLKTRAEIKAEIATHAACASFRHRLQTNHSDLTKWSFRVLCAEDVDCPYVVLATYFLQPRGHAAGTLVLSSLRQHEHNSQKNSGKIFTPAQKAVAAAFLAEGAASARDLLLHLQAKCPGSPLPNVAQISNWIRREKQKAKLQNEAPPHHAENVVGTVALSLESWYPTPAEIHGLYVLSRGVVCSDAETFIPFTCPGMMSVLSRYSAVDVLLGVDSKQKVLDRGMGVLTVSLLAKTGLRNTRLQGTRQQIRACVTRGLPVLQAIIHAESSPNADRMFALLEQLWVETHGSGRPPLRDCVKQVHKDFAPAFESARLLHFPNSRPCDDYFHLRQKYRELDARLSQTHVENGCFVKTHLGWLRACLQCIRFVPRLSLFHFCWQGLMNRLQAKEEPLVAAYLTSTYTQTLPASFSAAGHDPECWFASFWCGYEGIVPGTGCGSEPAEALHSDWQKNFQSRVGRSTLVSALPVMQQLYDRWCSLYEWNAADPLDTRPVPLDPVHLHGTAAFLAAGRTPALLLWNAHSEEEPSYMIFNISESLAFVAVRMSLRSNPLALDVCSRVVELLHCDASSMPSRLCALNVLQTSDSGFLFYLAPYKQIFDQIAFVRIDLERRCCSCPSFAMWGGCEHEVLSRGLKLAFAEPSLSFANVPCHRKRGRPLNSGTIVTPRARRRTARLSLIVQCMFAVDSCLQFDFRS
jgi:hypothetical protein